MSQYVSTQETAQRWGVSPRYVQRLAAAGRLAGAKRYGNYWMIPADAEKPSDPRRASADAANASPVYRYISAFPLAKNACEASWQGLEPRSRALAQADIAFRQGDPEPAKACWRTLRSDPSNASPAASLAIAAAICTGDYALYEEIRRCLDELSRQTRDPQNQAILSLPGALAAVSMAVPQMTPRWLTECDFSLFPMELRPFLLYLYALHLRNTRDYSAMLATANAALTLCAQEATFTWLDVYFGVLCAVAAYAQGELDRSERYLSSTLSLALPYGFIAPFADYLGDLGGTLENLLDQCAPSLRKQTIALWNANFKNWMTFHNDFAKDNITTLLTAQEYHVAHLIARGATYTETASRLHLSVSRVKTIQSSIFSKLYIQRKSGLSRFIL